jgi:hypothetical protein
MLYPTCTRLSLPYQINWTPIPCYALLLQIGVDADGVTIDTMSKPRTKKVVTLTKIRTPIISSAKDPADSRQRISQLVVSTFLHAIHRRGKKIQTGFERKCCVAYSLLRGRPESR